MNAVVDEPSEEFWSRYNKRSEFPLSAAATVLLHVVVAGLLAVTLIHLMSRSPRNNSVAVQLVPDLGLDDDGVGGPGSGGILNPQVKKDAEPLTGPEAALPNIAPLPAVQPSRPMVENPEGAAPVPEAKIDFSDLDALLRSKQAREPGAKQGAGTEGGRGESGQKGPGPSGDGKDNSRARSLRWVLRFTTTDGRDYLNQLAAMNAEVVVPIPPDNKQAILFSDLKDVKKQRTTTDDDLKRLAGLVRFSDLREDSVNGVCAALNVTARPKAFWAFFPKSVEDELLKKELGFRNRPPEQIEETIFSIRVKPDGSVEIEVLHQTEKK